MLTVYPVSKVMRSNNKKTPLQVQHAPTTAQVSWKFDCNALHSFFLQLHRVILACLCQEKTKMLDLLEVL